MSSIRGKLVEALNNALAAQNKQQREHGEGELTAALDQNAPQVLPELIQIAGDSSLGPASELAAIRSKNYLLHFAGSAEVWDEHIVPPTRQAVFNQLPTATPTARRVLLASLRILLQDHPWPELIDMAGPVLQSSCQEFLHNKNNNNSNNNSDNQQQRQQELFNTIICALEAILVTIADFRSAGLIEAEIQNGAAQVLLPLLPPLFSMNKTEVASLVFAVFHSLIATNRPPALADDVLCAWMNEMLAFPEKFAGVAQESRKSFEFYIKAVYNIAVVAIQIVDVTGASASPGSNKKGGGAGGGGGKGKKGGKRHRAAAAMNPPTVYGYGDKFTTFFARFLNYVATTTISSFGSQTNDDRDTRDAMRSPALYSIRFLLNCASHEYAHEAFKNADLQQLVTRDLFAFVPFNDEDAELWEDDPREYLRMIADPDSQEVSLRYKATQLIVELCKPRRSRAPLAPLDAVLKGLSDHLRNAGAAPKLADGAIYVLANLRGLIRKQQHWWNGVGALLSELIAPLLSHKSSVLRAKAIWLCGAFSDVPFQDPSMFNNMVYGVMHRIEDDHPGVRSAVVTSVVQFLAQEKARPLVYELLHPIVDECLRLLDSVSSESVVLSLQCLVECFGPELRSSIANICDRLVQTILATNFELCNCDDPMDSDDDDGGAGNGGHHHDGGFDENNNNDHCAAAKRRRSASARVDSLAEIIVNSLKTLDGALEAMASNPSLVRSLQPRIGQMLEQLFTGDAADLSILEHAVNLMGTALRYCVPSNFSGADPECSRRFASPDEHRALIAPEMWKCLSLLERLVVEEGACEMFSLVMKPIDNFIGIIPLEFSTGSALFDLLKTCRHMLSLIPGGGGDGDEGGEGDDDFGLGGTVNNCEIEAAPQLLASLLEHIHPVGTIQDDEAFGQIIDMLTNALLKCATKKEQGSLKANLCLALLDCFIFDAQRTSARLDASFGGAAVFVREFVKFYKQRNAAKRYFSTPAYRSKVVALGLTSVLKLWIQSGTTQQKAGTDGARAMIEVVLHAVRNEREQNRKWLTKHSNEALERHRNSATQQYHDDDDDEDDDNDADDGVGDEEDEHGDITLEGDDDDDDDGDDDDFGKKFGRGNDDDGGRDGVDFGDDDDYDTPLNKINSGSSLIEFLSGCPVEMINAIGVGNMISKQELEDCANVSENVLQRDRELQQLFEREEEERAAAMMNNCSKK